MLQHRDIRFSATGHETGKAVRILLPLSVRISRPTGQEALLEAKRIVEHFRQAAGETEFSGARMAPSDLAASIGKQAAELTIEQDPKRGVRLRLLFSGVLTLTPGADFWARALTI